ncbi:MAG TPA: hypothetical protein VIM15_04650 [Gemmatimonadaceae bacterium]
MIRTLVHSLRCAVVALLALAIVSARPAMMLSHAGDGMQHGCGKAMASHHASGQSSHTGHHCSSTEDGTCCDDCLCACAVGADIRLPVVALTATYTHPRAVATRFAEVVREHRPLALRLPPPIGPPLFTRS